MPTRKSAVNDLVAKLKLKCYLCGAYPEYFTERKPYKPTGICGLCVGRWYPQFCDEEGKPIKDKVYELSCQAGCRKHPENQLERAKENTQGKAQ